MGYDPVFTAVEIATGTRVPSYNDDGAVLARGPVQVVAASIVVIIAGLAILAKEFTWAERTLDKAKEQASKATNKVKGTRILKRKSSGSS